MKINLFRRYKQEQKEKEEAKECEHDWEVVEKGDIYSRTYTHSSINGPYDFITKEQYNEHYSNNLLFTYPTFYHEQSENKVCIKCGECYNGIEIFKKGYEDQEQKKIDDKKEEEDRKVFAKKLWKERCC